MVISVRHSSNVFYHLHSSIGDLGTPVGDLGASASVISVQNPLHVIHSKTFIDSSCSLILYSSYKLPVVGGSSSVETEIAYREHQSNTFIKHHSPSVPVYLIKIPRTENTEANRTTSKIFQ